MRETRQRREVLAVLQGGEALPAQELQDYGRFALSQADRAARLDNRASARARRIDRRAS